MLFLINDLLSLSRLKSGVLKPSYSFVNGHALAAAAIAALGPQAEEKKVALKNLVPPETRLYVDMGLYTEVIKNLVSNAIKFCRPAGSVAVFAPDGERATLAVSDNGVGIEEGRLSRLFQQGQNISTLGTAMEQGTGLGLPLCWEVMQALGGTLRVDSAVGKGSVFFAAVPHVRPKVMVVDNDPAAIALLAEYCTRHDADLAHCHSADEALRMVFAERPHLVITDTVLAGGDGFAVIESIRKTEETILLPIIVIASDHEIATRERVFALGANDFVTKPVVAEDLLPRVKRFLG